MDFLKFWPPESHLQAKRARVWPTEAGVQDKESYLAKSPSEVPFPSLSLAVRESVDVWEVFLEF